MYEQKGRYKGVLQIRNNSRKLGRDMRLTAYSFCIFVSGAVFSSCIVSTVVGTAVDTTLEVAKVPFKVADAAVELARSEEDDE